MFTNEELDIIFKVFENLKTEDKDVEFLKKKMAIINEQRNIGDSANKMITELQDKLRDLEKVKNDSKESE